MGSMHYHVVDSAWRYDTEQGRIGLPYTMFVRNRKRWVEDTAWFVVSDPIHCAVIRVVFAYALKLGFIKEIPAFLENFNLHLK